MTGLEIARAYFEEHGRPMLERDFPALLPFLAVGLTGSGSECYGYDDEISRDHDFEPGFCIFLPGEETVDRRSAFLLERAYAKLPKEFRGLRREPLLPVGGARRGVLRTGEFFLEKVGAADGALDARQWLLIPEEALAEAVNGDIFLDNFGEVSRIRASLSYYPEDVRRKRLAGQLLLAGQAGQYNYPRCLRRGDTAAAQLAAFEFVRSVLSAIFLLNRRYRPYYKWSFRALGELPRLGELASPLETLISTGNGDRAAEEKTARMEEIADKLCALLAEQGLSGAPGRELEAQAYAVNDGIGDGELRNLHILAGV
ncbi:MAG: DUF4037 domain-containing protein [Oscillospiraceae bacterium]|nr:DUF4037 domain-containing protein [Oscillospiraceae bacterium]MBR4692785.1 DUF4037 domain-containing protein [Oscillospiraceae bacterium]